MRLAIGIFHGFMGWILMSVARILPAGLRAGAQRQAVLAACRMYALRGGIDEGASALVGSWGDAGRKTVTRLLEEDRIPRKHRFTAELFLHIAPES